MRISDAVAREQKCYRFVDYILYIWFYFSLLNCEPKDSEPCPCYPHSPSSIRTYCVHVYINIMYERFTFVRNIHRPRGISRRTADG